MGAERGREQPAVKKNCGIFSQEFPETDVGQRQRAPAALQEDLGSVPRTHTRQLTTACESSFRDSDGLF